jgi:hypothetical protein
VPEQVRGSAAWQSDPGAWQWWLILALGLVGGLSLVVVTRFPAVSVVTLLTLLVWWRYTQLPLIVYMVFVLTGFLLLADGAALVEYKRDVLVATWLAVPVWIGFALIVTLTIGGADSFDCGCWAESSRSGLLYLQLALAMGGGFFLGLLPFAVIKETGWSRCLWSLPPVVALGAWMIIVTPAWH